MRNKLNHKIPQFFFIMVLTLFSACTTRKKVTFDQSELKWLQPFNKTDTIVYQSANGFRDTIIFFGQQSSSSNVNNMEQGFYSTHSMSIKYKLTYNSYHKFIKINSAGEQVNGNDESSYLLSINKSNNTTGTAMEFYFLGLLFNEDFLSTIRTDSVKTLTLNETNAFYTELNVKEGIRSFEFSFQKGIISFLDHNGIKWERNN
jgi:hypothetical protein